MFYIDYNNKEFELFFEKGITQEEFEENKNYLLKLFLYWSSKTRSWIIPDKRIDEILLWFEKDNIDYSFTKDGTIGLDKINDLYQSETEFYRGISFDSSILNKDKKLFEFQKETVSWLLKRNNSLNALDAGLGKTLCNICVFSHLYNIKKIDSIFIIAPTGLPYHWKYEILDFVNIFEEDNIILINNESKIKPFEEYQDKKIIITPNHLFPHMLLSYRKDYKPKKSYKKVRWNNEFDLLQKWNKQNCLIVVDESHNFKNSKTLRTKALFNIKNQFKYKLLSSATPFIDGMEQSYTQMKFLDTSIIPMSEDAFKLYIADEIGTRYDRYGIISYNRQNIKKIKNNFKRVFIKKLKEEVPEMKVKKIFQNVYIEMNNTQRKLYYKIAKNELNNLSEEYNKITWKLLDQKFKMIYLVLDNPLLFFDKKSNNEIIQGLIEEYKNDLSKWKIEDDPKFQALKSKLENYIEYQKEKVIVYDFHPKTLDILYEKFKKYNPILIHGELKVKDKDKDRREKENIFNYDDSCKLILLSALTSSEGINLQKGGRRILVYTMPPALKYRQLQDRTTRIVSERDSINELFYYPETMDNYRVQKNLNKVDLNDKWHKEISDLELKNLLRGIV